MTPKILVVDDHVALAENIAEILGGAGYETAIADSAEQALALFEAGDIVAVITDFRLPNKSGAELITELRRRGSGVPAVVMSAYTDEGTVDAAETAGALAVLPKPVQLDRLLALVSSFDTADTDVLVVDDNQSLADNLAEVLRERGFRSFTGGSAEEALATGRRPKVALIDFRLPGRSGVELARLLNARDPRVRILFLTACSDELRERLGRELAGTPSLDKPVDIDRLIAWVRQAMEDAAARPHRR